MKKLPSTLPNMILSLGCVTIIAGALLGWVYDLTAEPVARQKKEMQVAAIREVAPRFDNDIEADSVGIDIDGQHYTVYPARLGGRFTGAAVQGSSMNGFAGEVKLMVGYDADGTITDYRVLQQAETPGLGTKMETWFRDPAGARSVIGRNPATTSMFVTKDTDHHGEIDAITAATISSRAFLECLRGTHAAFETYLNNAPEAEATEADAATGATTGNHTRT